MDETLKSLIEDLIEGDPEAFNSIYRSYYLRLFNFANFYCRNHFTAENIVQDTFTSLWDMREKIEPQINLPGYLLTMVKNKSLNHLQHIKVQVKIEEQIQNNIMRELGLRQRLLTACNPEEMFHSDVQRIIKETLNTVSPQCRRVISMSRFDGLSNKQIANQLNISVKGVEFQITKGLKVLRKNLKDYLSFFIFILIRSLF